MGHDGDRQSGTVKIRVSTIRSPWGLVVLLFVTAAASYPCRVNSSVVGALMMRDLRFSRSISGAYSESFCWGVHCFNSLRSGRDPWGARLVLARIAP
jgi:hypothetical protein